MNSKKYCPDCNSELKKDKKKFYCDNRFWFGLELQYCDYYQNKKNPPVDRGEHLERKISECRNELEGKKLAVAAEEKRLGELIQEWSKT